MRGEFPSALKLPPLKLALDFLCSSMAELSGLHQQAAEIARLLFDARSYVASDDLGDDLGYTKDDHRSTPRRRHEQPVEARGPVPARLASRLSPLASHLSSDCTPRRHPSPRPERRWASRKASLRRCEPCSRGEGARAWSSAATAAAAAAAAAAAVSAGEAVPVAAPRHNGVTRKAVAAHRPPRPNDRAHPQAPRPC